MPKTDRRTFLQVLAGAAGFGSGLATHEAAESDGGAVAVVAGPDEPTESLSSAVTAASGLYEEFRVEADPANLPEPDDRPALALTNAGIYEWTEATPSWTQTDILTGTAANKLPPLHAESIDTPTVITEEASIAGVPFEVDNRLWAGTKHPDNPLIDPDDNADASNEQYTPAIALVDGTYWAYIKSDELNPQALLRLWKSTDGINWTRKSTTFGPSDSNLTVDQIVGPVFVYDSGTYHLYYRGAGNTDDGKIGHASGSAPDSLTDDANNPVLTPSDFNTELGPEGSQVTTSHINPTDVIQHRGTGEYILYCTAVQSVNNSSPAMQYPFTAVADSLGASSWTPRTIVAGPTDFPRSGGICGNDTSVFYHSGMYYALMGVGISDSGTADARETYCLVGDGYHFEPVRGIAVDTGGGWEANWVYGGEVLKEQDGNFDRLVAVNDNYRFYYNGQDGGTNTLGSVGLIEFPKIPSPSVLKRIQRQSIPIVTTSTSITSTTAGSNTGDRVTRPEGRFRYAFLSGEFDSAANESTNVAVGWQDAEGNEAGSQLGTISTSANGFNRIYGDPFEIPAFAAALNLESWVSGGTGEILIATINLYDANIRDDGNLR